VQLLDWLLSLASLAVHVLCITISPLQGPVEVVISWYVIIGVPQDGSVGVAVACPVADGLVTPLTGQADADTGQVIDGALQQLPTTVTLKLH